MIMEDSLKPLVYAIVKKLQQQRIADGILPNFVPFNDVLGTVGEMVKSAANTLIKENKLEWFKNVNGIVMLGIADGFNLEN